MPDTNLPSRQSRAFIWSAIESISKQGVGFALSFAVVAFVTPHDLGVYSMTFSLVIVLALIVDDPICEALIQRPLATASEWNTGFTINLLMACGVFTLAFATSGLLATALKEPDLGTALPSLATCIIIGALGNVQKAYLARELRFGALAKIALIANTSGGIIALGLALAGLGYWAMISNMIATNIIGSALYWRRSSWKPRFEIWRQSVGISWRFAVKSFALYCILMLREGMLPILIGRISGTTALGYFSLAFRISRTFGLLFEDIIRRPLFTIVSQLQNEPSRSASLLLNVTTIVGTLGLPTFVGIALVGPSLTILIFGIKWSQGAHLLPLLCAVVFGWFTLHIPTVAMRARGDVSAAGWLLSASALVDLILAIILLPFGIETALLGIVIRTVVSMPVILLVIQWRLGVSGAQILSRWRSPLLGVSAMTICVESLEPLFGTNWGGVLALIASGATAYAFTICSGMLFGDRYFVQALKNL